jgi:hypothetical protein
MGEESIINPRSIREMLNKRPIEFATAKNFKLGHVQDGEWKFKMPKRGCVELFD